MNVALGVVAVIGFVKAGVYHFFNAVQGVVLLLGLVLFGVGAGYGVVVFVAAGVGVLAVVAGDVHDAAEFIKGAG